MTVKELIQHLKQFPSDMDCARQMYSDYAPLEPPVVEEVIDGPDGRRLRYFYNQFTGDKQPRTVKVCFFGGN